MTLIEALILGIVQGLTEFLPISSSGHLEIGKVLLGVEFGHNLPFTIAVHGATVLSTIAVFRHDIAQIMGGLFRFAWNEHTRFVAMILVSMVPVALVGLFLRVPVESLFDGDLLLVGAMLLVTASLLALTQVIRPREPKPIGFVDALVIGIAQALAVLPGLSRSGATIATGLLLGKDRAQVARFSFLMVLVPIMGANLLDVMRGQFASEVGVGSAAILVGSAAAFVSGFLACSWMLTLVKRGKLIYFAIYCALVGTVSIAGALLT